MLPMDPGGGDSTLHQSLGTDDVSPVFQYLQLAFVKLQSTHEYK